MNAQAVPFKGNADIGRLLDDGAYTTMQKVVVFLAAMSIVMDGFDGQLIGFAIPLDDQGVGHHAQRLRASRGRRPDRHGDRQRLRRPVRGPLRPADGGHRQCLRLRHRHLLPSALRPTC